MVLKIIWNYKEFYDSFGKVRAMKVELLLIQRSIWKNKSTLDKSNIWMQVMKWKIDKNINNNSCGKITQFLLNYQIFL